MGLYLPPPCGGAETLHPMPASSGGCTGLQLGTVLQAMLLRLLEGVWEGLRGAVGGLRGPLTVRESLMSRTA